MSTADAKRFRLLDICSGAGGLALGLEQAGFEPVLLLDNRPVVCETLRLNRPNWTVLEADLLDFDPVEHPEAYDVDLLSAGLPRVRAIAASARRDRDYERRLLEATVLLMHAVQPRALLIENVAELATGEAFAPIRAFMQAELEHLGYQYRWFVVNAADFGVPQSRKQGILVAFKGLDIDSFMPPERLLDQHLTVGDALYESMASKGWPDAEAWAAQAGRLAPTIVGGSWERGGPDLGPSGAKRSWARLGVDGGTIADDVPTSDFHWDPALGRQGLVRLTVAQVARLQGFPDDWRIAGAKTARYRQVGEACPPPVARALGLRIAQTLGW